jgi:hypothetical protein
MNLLPYFEEQLSSLKDKEFIVKDLKGKPHFGDKEWKEGDVPLFAMFLEGTDLHLRSFAERHLEEIWKEWAILKKDKFPQFVRIPTSCQSCGKPEFYTGLDIQGNKIPLDPNGYSEYRTCFICEECCTKLDPDIWITREMWEELNPKVPYNVLPIEFDRKHPLW